MENLQKSACLDLVHSEWQHWHMMFSKFGYQCDVKAPKKLWTLENCVSHNIYEYIEKCIHFYSVISILEKLDVKTSNEIFVRYLLTTRHNCQANL